VTLADLYRHAFEAEFQANLWRSQPNGEALAAVRHRDALACHEAAGRLLASLDGRDLRVSLAPAIA
jgi:hypothetical protein